MIKQDRKRGDRVTGATGRGRRADAAVSVAPRKTDLPRRRTKRDPESTHERILQAAMVEFCRHGLNGARVDKIVAGARINPRMLYHYFGSKSGLYVMVLERAYAELRARERALKLSDLPSLEGMRRLMDFTFDHFGSHPDLIHLINNENLLRARYLRQSKRIAAMTSPLIMAIRDLLRRGEADGSFRRGVDPIQLYVSITALSYFHVSNRYTLSTLFAVDIAERDWLAWRRAHAREMLLCYLSPRCATAMEPQGWLNRLARPHRSARQAARDPGDKAGQPIHTGSAPDRGAPPRRLRGRRPDSGRRGAS